MYIYDEHKLKKENRKRRLFILTDSLLYVILPITIGFLKISKNIIINMKVIEVYLNIV